MKDDDHVAAIVWIKCESGDENTYNMWSLDMPLGSTIDMPTVTMTKVSHLFIVRASVWACLLLAKLDETLGYPNQRRFTRPRWSYYNMRAVCQRPWFDTKLADVMLCTHNVIGEASLPLFDPAGRNNMLYNGRKSNALMQHGEPLTCCCDMGDDVKYVWSRAYSHTCVPVDHRDPAETHRPNPTRSRE